MTTIQRIGIGTNLSLAIYLVSPPIVLPHLCRDWRVLASMALKCFTTLATELPAYSLPSFANIYLLVLMQSDREREREVYKKERVSSVTISCSVNKIGLGYEAGRRRLCWFWAKTYPRGWTKLRDAKRHYGLLLDHFQSLTNLTKLWLSLSQRCIA